MTDGRDDAPDGDDGSSPPDEGEGLDELVEPSVDLRTAQEKDAASDDASGAASETPTGDPSGSGATAGESEAAAEGLDELVEPSVDLRTAQEREAASASDEETDDAGGGGRDA